MPCIGVKLLRLKHSLGLSDNSRQRQLKLLVAVMSIIIKGHLNKMIL